MHESATDKKKKTKKRRKKLQENERERERDKRTRTDAPRDEEDGTLLFVCCWVESERRYLLRSNIVGRLIGIK